MWINKLISGRFLYAFLFYDTNWNILIKCLLAPLSSLQKFELYPTTDLKKKRHKLSETRKRFFDMKL